MNITNQQPVRYTFYPIQPSIIVNSNSTQQQQPLIRSIKIVRPNQNAEQKTQYLERILRLAQQQQQKFVNQSAAFDRLRFADQSNVTTVVTQAEKPADNTNQVDSDDDIIIESVIPKSSNLQSWSGFLIDNCDEAKSPLVSPSKLTLPKLSPTIATSVDENKDDSQPTQNSMLIDELNTARIEQKEVLKHRTKLRKRLQQRSSSVRSQITVEQIAPSDLITNSNEPLSQLIDMVEKIPTNDADKRVQINLFLEKIKEQQVQLKKLSQYVSSMLDDNYTDQCQNILTNFVNQPLTSGCWLCSGKTYTEVAIQCNSLDE